MARIGIIGSEGRMGQAIAALLAEGEHQLAGGADVFGAGRGDAAIIADRSDVLVDFSSPQALDANLHAAVGAGVPIVIGTTGLTEKHHRAIDHAAYAVAVLQTGNTSLGVTLLAHLVREAATRLGPDWDIEILEMHHRMKVDAPSGTAQLLGEAVAHARGMELGNVSEHDGHPGGRREGAIGFASLRGGTAAGEHSVIFAGSGERLTLAHSAENRVIFARGAIRAAEWLIGKPAGRYTMAQVLGI